MRWLWIDRFVELVSGQRAVAIKNVSVNEPFFQGHWPERAVMPGVLQIEAMAQVGEELGRHVGQNTAVDTQNVE